MYRPLDKMQTSFFDFNQPLGMHMNPKNRWVDLAHRIPWDILEAKYEELFPSSTGNVVKPLRMALGSLIIQTKFQYSDRELVEQITENPYLQYFIGLPGYQEEPPFDASILVLFRKRLSLLNEAREKLETIVYRFWKSYDLSLPRRYIRKARKVYLAFAKARKHSIKQICKEIKKQLSYVRRDLKLVEFGAKLDLSMDENSYSRIEHISFEAYNESGYLQEAIERYQEHTGHYPERLLVDQIYRTRENRKFCKRLGIRMSGPKLGSPGKTEQEKSERRQEHQDNKDRIEVEQEFSVEKHSYGLGLITIKLEETQLTSIALSVFTANLFKMQRKILCTLLCLCESFFASISETIALAA